MRMQTKWVSIGMMMTACALAPASAYAARLYLGLPNGTHAVYDRNPGAAAWTPNATAALPDVGYYAAPALADLDGDGDRDALVGESGGRVLAYVNTGTDAQPVWVRQP